MASAGFWRGFWARGRLRWLAVSVLALLAALLVAALVLPGPREGPTEEETAAAFLTALREGDAALVAQLLDDQTLSQQRLEPLLAGGQEEEFLAEVATMLAQPAAAPDALFWLEDRGSGRQRRVVVCMGTAEVAVRSNLPDARITVGQQTAQWEPSGEVAVAAGLMPGRYQVRGVTEVPQSGQFQAEASLLVTMPRTACRLEFDYRTLEIYNNATAPVRIQVNGSDFATLAPRQELVLEPVLPDTRVTAVGPGEQMLSATGDDGYFYVSFSACRLELYNDYDIPMHVDLDGRWLADIPPRDMLTLETVPAGQKVRAYLDEGLGLEPFEYRAAYDFDYLYPVFALRRESYDALRLTAETYALVAYERYAQGYEALAQLPETALTRDLQAMLQADPLRQLTAREITLARHDAPQPQADGTVRVIGTLRVVEQAEPPPGDAADEPTPEQERLWTVALLWQDGLWSVVPEPPPTEAPQAPPEPEVPQESETPQEPQESEIPQNPPDPTEEPGDRETEILLPPPQPPDIQAAP